MDFRLYALSIITFIALKISYTSSQPSDAADSAIEDPASMDTVGNEYRLGQIYSLEPEDADEFEKRRSLMRFGKRRSIMRFGKRGSILRFGKRGSLMRFGKRDGYDQPLEDEDYLSPNVYEGLGEYAYGDDYGNVKRGSLMRFGKKSSIMRFGRSIASRTGKSKAHTPWRFGREDQLIL